MQNNLAHTGVAQHKKQNKVSANAEAAWCPRVRIVQGKSLAAADVNQLANLAAHGYPTNPSTEPKLDSSAPTYGQALSCRNAWSADSEVTDERACV